MIGPRWAWVLLLCLLVAVGDELHQRMVPGRSFRVSDVGIDLLGGSVGAFLTAIGWGRNGAT